MRYVCPPFASLKNVNLPGFRLVNPKRPATAGLAIALILSGWVAPAALAQDVDTGGSPPSDAADFPDPAAFPDFTTTGRSGNRVGGASRGGGCVQLVEEPLTPLAPVEAGYGGRTLQAHPTMWVHVPYQLNADSPVSFSLLDGAGDTVYQTTFTTEMAPGLMGFTLPSSVTLETGETYDWYFLVYCNDPQRRDVPAFASGWIERVSFASERLPGDLATMAVGDRSRFYARELLWYDALDTLARSMDTAANDPQLLESWNWLLGLPSVQLEEFVDAAIQPCCQLED